MEFSLDDPIKKMLPNGYDMCAECGAYFHHPFRWCPTCGTRSHKEKEMSWREFLAITAHHGSGPLNTIHVNLAGGWGRPEDPEKLKIYEEATQIWKDNGGDAPFVSGEKEKKCPFCGYKHEGIYTFCYLCRTSKVLRISIKADRGEKLSPEERYILRDIRKSWKKKKEVI